MKKLLKIFSRSVVIALASLVIGSATFAHAATTHDTTEQPDYNGDDYSFKLSGAGACQSDGSFLIVWVITNISSPPYTNTSNPVLDLDSQLTGQIAIAADTTQTFNQTVDGAKSSVTSLSATGSWGTDVEDAFTTSASVTLETACTQPQAPVTQQLLVSPIVRGSGK